MPSFPSCWVACGTQPWQCDSTYGLIEGRFLPVISAPDPRQLAKLAMPEDAAVIQSLVENAERIHRLRAGCAALHLELPPGFEEFVTVVDLHQKVPTCTDCYLDLSEDVLAVPARPGEHLVRFLEDSQACVMWYLWFGPGMSEPAVVAAPGYYDRKLFDKVAAERAACEDDTPGEPRKPAAVYEDLLAMTWRCSGSFAEFIERFRIENTLWNSITYELPIGDVEAGYLASLQAARTAGARARRLN